MTHPAIKAIADHPMPLAHKAKRGGVAIHFIRRWIEGGRPSLDCVERVLRPLGLRLDVVPLKPTPIPFIRWSARR